MTRIDWRGFKIGGLAVTWYDSWAKNICFEIVWDYTNQVFLWEPEKTKRERAAKNRSAVN